VRSGALARLAGVTVRALRHYHRLGVLAEPARGGNGYRSYDVHDLIRVLRIKHLASLGIPLARMPGLLDDTTDDGAARLLQELDVELAQEIDRLARQRAVIARLLEHDARPDVPPELAPFLAAYAAAGPPPELLRFDRDQTVLLAHLAGSDGTTRLAAVYERFAEPGHVAVATALSARFARIGPDSSDHDIDDLVGCIVAAFAPVFAEIAAADPPLDPTGSTDLVAEFIAGTFNDRQREALARLEARLAP
jgi:DNA-binding transcriptional MerR regulator